MLLTIETEPVHINIIQVYAPTSDAHDDEIEDFYAKLGEITNKIKKEDLMIVMGDFNAKIGEGKYEELIGRYGLGSRNERGDRMLEFCIEQQLAVMNTFFKLPPRRLYTWKAPGDSRNNIIRSQIDYIMVNKRYQNSFLSVKTAPGADIASDHNPVIASIEVRLKKVQRTNKNISVDARLLKNEQIRTEAQQDLHRQILGISMEDPDNNIQEIVKNLESTFRNINEKHLKATDVAGKKKWMTDEILTLMDARRKVKNVDKAKYTEIDRQIKKKARKAKEQWLNTKCQEIEYLDSKHDNFNLHKKVREAAGTHRPKVAGRLLDQDGNLMLEKQERVQAWQKYIETLFKDQRNSLTETICNTGPRILKEEVEQAIKNGKEGKVPGTDGIHMEVIKLLDNSAIRLITTVFNSIYDNGELPEEWLRSTFVPIPKKHTAKTCSDYRTISIMSHLLKTFLKIIHNRLYRRCEEQMSNTQFGFRNTMGTREALFCMQVLFQRGRDMNCDIFACFIDYEKAFDTVVHEKLIGILEETGIDEKDIRIIKNLYWNQKANIKIEGMDSESVNIQRGVRQGCVLSPMLFNLYSEMIFKEALNEVEEGIRINGQLLNNLRYADDTVIFADSMEGLQHLLNSITSASERYGLKINVTKTKFMVISKHSINPGRLLLNNEEIERVEKFTYLGSLLNEQWDHSIEIKSRIEKARAAFKKISTVLKNHSLSIKLKLRLVKCYVFPVLLYGMESWTLTEASINKINAFEMWTYRRILRIQWTEHISSEEVLRRMKTEREVMKTIKRRKLEYLGHIMRHPEKYALLQLILQGKVEGRRGPGRRRISWLKNLRTWFNTTTTELFRTAANKVTIALWIANIR